jgi:Ca2+-binding RTX toxin-like protein
MGVSVYTDLISDQFIQADTIVSEWINQYTLLPTNTTIVGHSLGGSLAQYYGGQTGFDTLTYNAYGIGLELEPGEYNNITNYVTMDDPVSKLIGSQMVGNTYMLQDETLNAAAGHGILNFTNIDNWIKGYSKIDNPTDIQVIDGLNLTQFGTIDELYLMLIEGRKFAKINNSMDDIIYGSSIDNILIGGSGDDTLYGNGGTDILIGGADNDTYIYKSGHTTITDTSGIDTLNININTNPYNATYSMIGDNLLIKYDEENTLTIENWLSDNTKIETITATYVDWIYAPINWELYNLDPMGYVYGQNHIWENKQEQFLYQ